MKNFVYILVIATATIRDHTLNINSMYPEVS